MGRLVKVFSSDGDDTESHPDDTQILRKAGEAVGRIQQEMRAAGAGNDSTTSSVERPTANSNRRQLGRDVNSEQGIEQAQATQSPSFSNSDHRDFQEGLRLFTGSDEVQPEASRGLSRSELIQQELMEELVQERNRWTERHAMQVQSIEEQARQIARVDAEIELREQELDRRERELDARTREVAAQARSGASQAAHDGNSAQQEMERLVAEVRIHADRASRFEAELAEARSEHAVELDALRGQLTRDVSRETRAKSIIDECDQRMAELAAERSDWQAEQFRCREELARERLELRQQREAQLVELKAAQKDFEAERNSSLGRLEQERREWKAKFDSEQDELLDLKLAVENEVARLRGDISREKAEWDSRKEQLRVAYREEQQGRQQTLADVERARKEQTAQLEAMRKEFESERAAWHRQRGQEAAILQTERSEIDTEADRLRAERNLIELERQQLAAELENQRAEHDEAVRKSWASHQESIQQSEQEATNRQRVQRENLQQQENELATRMQQAEHEIRTARELSSRQIAQERERFSQTCATHEADLNRARAELHVQRQLLKREKLEFAEEISREREQTEQQRTVVRNSLSQMDAQLRVAATSLLSGAPAEVVAAGFAQRLQPSVEAIESSVTESETINDEEAEADTSDVMSLDSESPADEELDSTDPAIEEIDSTENELIEDEHGPVDAEVAGEEDDVAEHGDTRDSDVSAWEPGKEATLVESPSSEVIRRVDSATESGGVSGLQKGPRIASHGVVAQATAEALAAEMVYEDSDQESEWAGTVESRAEDVTSDSDRALQDDGRRLALESYRSKLSSLQEQLRQLSSHSSADDNSSSDPADA